PRAECLVSGLGRSWEILANTYKPYPCGVVLNPVVEACLGVRRDHPDIIERIEEIEDIEVRGNSLLKERTDRPPVNTGREAQVSARHTVAVALLQGAAGIPQYQDEVVRDPSVRQLGNRVRVTADDSFAIDAAEIRIRMRFGKTIIRRIDHARGGPECPLSDADLEAKLATQAVQFAPWLDPAMLSARLWRLDEEPDVNALLSSIVPGN